MNIKFAHRMKDYEAGIFQVLNEKKDEAERQGRTIYNLSVGTPDFPPAAHVVEAVVKASAKPENYTYELIAIRSRADALQEALWRDASEGRDHVRLRFPGRDRSYLPVVV